jgi:hypothetical protein
MQIDWTDDVEEETMSTMRRVDRDDKLRVVVKRREKRRGCRQTKDRHPKREEEGLMEQEIEG